MPSAATNTTDANLPVIVAGTIDVAAAIIAESTLSFLGLGFPPDIPTWGNILREAKDNLDFAPHWAIFPGTAIFLASSPDRTPVPLLANLKHNHVLHDRNLIVTVTVTTTPVVSEAERMTLEMAVAPIALALANHPHLEDVDLSSLRYIMWGATPVSASVRANTASVARGRSRTQSSMTPYRATRRS